MSQPSVSTKERKISWPKFRVRSPKLSFDEEVTVQDEESLIDFENEEKPVEVPTASDLSKPQSPPSSKSTRRLSAYFSTKHSRTGSKDSATSPPSLIDEEHTTSLRTSEETSLPPAETKPPQRQRNTWLQKPLLPRTQLQIGAAVAPRCEMDEASVHSKIGHIEYGSYNGEAACLLIIDFRLVFQPATTIKAVDIEFRFASSPVNALQPNVTIASVAKAIKASRATTACNPMMPDDAYFPQELTGHVEHAQEMRASNPTIGAGFYGAKLGVSGMGATQRGQITKSQWRVQGNWKRHDGVTDALTWKVIENKYSKDSVPRDFRVGMIVFVPTSTVDGETSYKDLWMDTTIEGALRGKMPRWRTVTGLTSLKASEIAQEKPAPLLENELTVGKLNELVAQKNDHIKDIEKSNGSAALLQARLPLPALPSNVSPSNFDAPSATQTQDQSQLSSGGYEREEMDQNQEAGQDGDGCQGQEEVVTQTTYEITEVGDGYLDQGVAGDGANDGLTSAC